MKSESFLTLHRQQHNRIFQTQKRSKDITINNYISGSTKILRSCENTFCVQRKQNKNFIQQFFSFKDLDYFNDVLLLF